LYLEAADLHHYKFWNRFSAKCAIAVYYQFLIDQGEIATSILLTRQVRHNKFAICKSPLAELVLTRQKNSKSSNKIFIICDATNTAQVSIGTYFFNVDGT
jgi:hypothetical protein